MPEMSNFTTFQESICCCQCDMSSCPPHTVHVKNANCECKFGNTALRMMSPSVMQGLVPPNACVQQCQQECMLASQQTVSQFPLVPVSPLDVMSHNRSWPCDTDPVRSFLCHSCLTPSLSAVVQGCMSNSRLLESQRPP